MIRIPPSKHLSQMASELSSRTDAEDLAGQLARLGAQKLIQELLEAEVGESLGRDRYERGGRSRGHRNGTSSAGFSPRRGPFR
jgi:transposase-like protein